MTLNVVIGSGEMPIKELTASLVDLQTRASQDQDDFWFLVQAKAEPTATDKALMAWLDKKENGIYYDIISDGSDVDPIYLVDPQNTYNTKRMAPTLVKLMQDLPDKTKNETAQLLALFTSDDFSDPADRWLNDVGAAVQEAGFVVRAFNDGLVEVDMLDEGDEEEAEEEAEEEDAEEVEGVEEEGDDSTPPFSPNEATEEQLNEMTREQLIAHAAVLGVTFPPRTRIHTMINTLLAGSAPAESEEEEVAEPQTPSLSVVSSETTSTAGTPSYVSVTSISAPAMMIIVANGTVTSKVVTPEQVERIMSIAS